MLLLLFCADDEVGDDGLLDDEEDGQVEEEAEDASFEQGSGETGEDGKAEEPKQQDRENASGNAVGVTAAKTLTDADVCVHVHAMCWMPGCTDKN